MRELRRARQTRHRVLRRGGELRHSWTQCDAHLTPQLPDEFIKAIPNVGKADLLIIMGTSLTVHPFAGLAERAGATCPRVLINLDLVGSIGRRPNDVVLLGKCDDVVRKLCRELGWEDELMELWAQTEIKASKDDSYEPQADEDGGAAEEATAEDLVGTITDAIGRQLNLEEPESKNKEPESKTEEPESKTGDAAPATTAPSLPKEQHGDTVATQEDDASADGPSVDLETTTGKL